MSDVPDQSETSKNIETAAVIIVGGGVAGCSVAYQDRKSVV
jgi:monoamine oxidase